MLVQLMLAGMIPPPVLPAGPIAGRIECMLDTAGADDAVWIDVAESDAVQVSVHGRIPVDASRIGVVELRADGSVALASNEGDHLRLTRVANGRDVMWMRMERTTGPDPRIGLCTGNLFGREDRPVTLTRLRFVRVD